MELSLSQLALLIELTEVELAEMKEIIENPNTPSELADDCSEHSLQLLSLSSALQSVYKSKWTSSEDEVDYNLLINNIHERRL